MDTKTLRSTYADLANLQLMSIAWNESYTTDAREAARELLVERLGPRVAISPEKVLQHEVDQAAPLLGRCHLCGAEAPAAFSFPFYLCRPVAVRQADRVHAVGTMLAKLALHAIPIVGPLLATVPEEGHYSVRPLSTRLCGDCAGAYTHPGPDGTLSLADDKDLCARHPLYPILAALGFREIKWPSEIRSDLVVGSSRTTVTPHERSGNS
jgi:hypothetical protein